MNAMIYNKIKHINKLLTRNILEKIENKKVLLRLSGGHDTRVNLSIFLKQNLEFTAYTMKFSKGDIKLAKKIMKNINHKHLINEERDIKIEQEIFKNFDVLIGGRGFSEHLCILHKMNKSQHMIEEYQEGRINDGKNYSPFLNQKVIDAAKDIPLCYLAGGIVQKIIISMNAPELLNFPFTYYDLRHKIFNKYYIYVAEFIFNSYYRGSGRNYYDDKKSKDQWWGKNDPSFNNSN